MKNEWARDIKDAITRYREQVIPMIDEGPDCYCAAGLELGNSIFGIRDGYKNMPKNATKAYTWGLLARFRLLEKNCLEEGVEEKEKKASVEWAINAINEKLVLVEFSVDAVLKADDGQNGEPYQQGL